MGKDLRKRDRTDYYKKNRKRILENSQRYYWAHRNKIRLRHKKWNDNNKGKIKELHLKKLFGISLDEYQIRLIRQKERCAICRGTEFHRKGDIHFCIDYDHRTGKVRGLLCQHCNRMIGLAKENIRTLKRAIQYIKNGGSCN